ncbi:MAG: thioesterase family protein [Planctomycetota bacterium]
MSTETPLRSGITHTRVRYAETDTGQVVYHSHYLIYFEVGRTELMRELGTPYRQLEDEDGVILPVVDVRVRYLQSARYDDHLRIETDLIAVTGARLRFGYRVLNAASGVLLCEGETVLGCIDAASGRPKRLPKRLLTLL